VRYRLRLDTAGVEGVNDPGKLLILRRADSSAAWTPLATQYADSALATRDTLASFGEFTVGADAKTNPLPVDDESTTATFALHAPYPNPARGQATIRYELPEASHVSLVVYDVLGRRVEMVVDEQRAAGLHRVRFEASDLPSGIYVAHVRAGPHSATRKLTVVK
jgi:hypothetical protein